MADSQRVLLLVFSGIFGLLVGSFLNVCIFRLPRNCMSVARGRSKCPRCRKEIAGYDNIPVVSWIALRGRCRNCRAPISPRYALVELLTGGLFAWAAWVQLFDPTLALPWQRIALYAVQCYLLGAILVSTFIDLDFEILPDEINYSGVVLGLAAGAAIPQVLFPALRPGSWLGWAPPVLAPHVAGLAQSALGALLGGGIIYATGVLGKILFRRRIRELRLDSAMGGGDVKYLAFLGAFLGVEGIGLVFLVSVVTGALFGIGKLVLRRGLGKVPFGPFLSLGAVGVLFARPQIIAGLQAYLNLFRRGQE